MDILSGFVDGLAVIGLGVVFIFAALLIAFVSTGVIMIFKNARSRCGFNKAVDRLERAIRQ